MPVWTAVLNSQGFDDHIERMSAMELVEPESSSPPMTVSTQAEEAAQFCSEHFPDASWLIEQDVIGNVRITVRV